MADTADHRALKQALGRYPTGVTVVTARRGDGEPVGLTVNSFTSVSLEPPLILWCLDHRSPNLEAFRSARAFAVNVLAADQGELSTRFARPVEDKFQGVDWQPDAEGAPVLGGAVARLSCRGYAEYPGGDHVILLGEVVDFADTGGDPLVYTGGAYRVAREE
ncbi:MAG: flavin reductase family protein [Ectothiorhodospiraceae bacterium]